jgi:carbamoyl-phosphate synthase large subunit
LPRRNDIESILIIGSGPIIIGQAAEFDYSGTQACRALSEEGYRVVLANSNPATIMTDPEVSDATYVEPLTAEIITEILRRERPDALLPTLGGQTALNLAVELHEKGALDEYGVELLGASISSIHKAEDRHLFREAMERIGLKVPESRVVRRVEEALEFARQIRFPLIIRPSFTLGGKGGATANDPEELSRAVSRSCVTSPTTSSLSAPSRT